MGEEPVYAGRLCTVKKTGKLLTVEAGGETFLYERGELLVEVQMIMAAILREARK